MGFPESNSARRCGIAFGSNMGAREDFLVRARDELISTAADPGGIVLVSPLFETAPIDCAPGTSDFLNAVIEITSVLEPISLLKLTKGIEGELGRPGIHGYHSPRTVDLDILYVGDLAMNEAEITLPHPAMTKRRFVLEPLSRIRPELRLPGQTATVSELLAELGPPSTDVVKEYSVPEWDNWNHA